MGVRRSIRGTRPRISMGDEEPTCTLAVTGNHACSMGKPAQVCDRPAGNSIQGVCDLSGNVWEFVLTVFPPPSEQRKHPGFFRADNPWLLAKELPFNKTMKLYKKTLNEAPSTYPGKVGSEFDRPYWGIGLHGVRRDGPAKSPTVLPKPVQSAVLHGIKKSWKNNTTWQIIRGGGHWHTVEFFNRARARFFVPNDIIEGNIGFRCAFRTPPPTIDQRRASLNLSPRRRQRVTQE